MATPYFQIRRQSVASTQDVALEELDDLPVLVLATEQSLGRGRSGAEWMNASRALAASLAIRLHEADQRPFSLMAGLAALKVAVGSCLKWPNDVMIRDRKVGGILVERSGEVVVIGLGMNLWWPKPPEAMGGIYSDDPGEETYAELGGLWGAELMNLIETDGWPIDEYRERCATLGRQITWTPFGQGEAVDIGEDGALIVETAAGKESLRSGVVREVRG